MDTRPLVKLPGDLFARCIDWGARSVLGYERGEKESSRQYARPGIDKSISKQALGKLAECAFCIYYNLDPDLLDWSPRLDRGWDCELFRVRVDVKGSDTEYLIWPVTKDWVPDNFNLFAQVQRLEENLFAIGGWCLRRNFFKRCHVAPPPDWLDPWTKHLHWTELRQDKITAETIEGLRWAARAIREGKVPEYIMGKWPC
jgi:hypothetical protein